ncbi:hypothetical protein PHET_08932 [Paragonimus heterotremus]|uniref:Uncharacterized protein n=1 Tax=Paragonimus heterotremus TaxID=100268 RepID=A0A8J4SLJ9_9TREM|nr:hypothetical protein PHET_08932 [Paragonimus heterotremus]
MSSEQVMRLLLEPWEQELMGQLIDFRAEVTWFHDITKTLDGLDNVNFLCEVSVTMSSHFESPQRSSFIPVLGIICEPLSTLLIDKILHKLESVLRRFIEHVEVMCAAVEPELRALTERLSIIPSNLEQFALLSEALSKACENENSLGKQVSAIRLQSELLRRFQKRLTTRWPQLNSLWPSPEWDQRLASEWRKFNRALCLNAKWRVSNGHSQFSTECTENLEKLFERAEQIGDQLLGGVYADPEQTPQEILNHLQQPFSELTGIEVQIHRLLTQKRTIDSCPTDTPPEQKTVVLDAEQTTMLYQRYLVDCTSELDRLDSRIEQVAKRREAWRLMTVVTDLEGVLCSQTLSEVSQ